MCHKNKNKCMILLEFQDGELQHQATEKAVTKLKIIHLIYKER